MLIAQISDCHIVDRGALFADRVDSAAGLRSAIDTINDLVPQPDLVIATGDLVNDGSPAQYDHLVDLLGSMRAPILPIPGNHDDRTQLRDRFADVLPPGPPDRPIDFVVDHYPVRLIALDTTIPGRHDGRLTTTQLAWLDERLTARPTEPTVVVQHHPPFTTGVRSMDATCGFEGGDAEAAVLERHPQVMSVLAGHIHRAIHTRFARTVASTCPSTASQLALEMTGGPVNYSTEPTGLMLHEYSGGPGLTSHLVAIGEYPSWAPPWAD